MSPTCACDPPKPADFDLYAATSSRSTRARPADTHACVRCLVPVLLATVIRLNDDVTVVCRPPR